jgi:hypothetical protein
LRESPVRQRRSDAPGPTTIVPIEPGHDYRLLAGQWYEVWWGVDAAVNPPAAIIVRKRGISRREKRDLGLLK